MRQSEKLNQVRNRVREKLIFHPHLQDDDLRLMANMWIEEIGGVQAASKMNAYELLGMFAGGKLTSPETIRRCRQKLQEQEPAVRGRSYKKRQLAGAEMRDDMN